MRKLTMLMLAFFAFQLQATTNQLQATTKETSSQVKISWQNPEKYADIRPANESKKSYQAQVINSFDKIWTKLAEKLPAGYYLELTITDLDLAGDVNPMYRLANNDVRVIKDIYFPRMQLNYILYNADKQIVGQANDVKIKDMGFMTSGSATFTSREFAYESEMIKKWFNKEILTKTTGLTSIKQ